jgi:1-acyl-sn-glycerol-3-phosphate acyltransferase
MAAKLRGAAFVLLAYALMGAMGVIGAPVVLWSERLSRAWMKLYIRVAFAMLRAICGLRVEIRGPVPQGDVIVAAKHQSLLDVLALYLALPEPRFVMKRELLLAPVFGLYARRAGCVPIDRSGGQGAVRAMIEAFRGRSGQLVIYPQGTRVAPGARAPYRRGAVALHQALGLPVVLVATNGGLYWPRRGIARYPGRAVIEVLGTLPAGLPEGEFAARIERGIEAGSDRLAAMPEFR